MNSPTPAHPEPPSTDEEALALLLAKADQQRRLFEAALSNTPDFIYVFDRQHRFTYCNEALLKAWGRKAEDAVGRTCLELGYPEWHAAMHDEEIERVVATKKPIRGEVPFKNTLGRRIYDYIFVPVFGADGEVEAIAGTTRDVTERKEAEEALRLAWDEGEKASRAKDRFLAVLSHELRTPLTPVLIALASLEQEPNLPAEAREDLAMMKRNIELETKLIDDLLDLSRITSGKLALKLAPLDLREALQRVLGICAAQAREKQVRVEFEPGPPAVMEGDDARLQQVFWNVLRNAIKFTPAGGVVKVFTHLLPSGRCVVRVHDSGVGIPAAALPHIFDAFEQGDARVTQEFGGLGLGLAIGKTLVELHGGTIRAESPGVGLGATFLIELPLNSTRPSADTPVAPPGSNGAAPHLRLLLVEDHPDTLRSLTRLLQRDGFEVMTASSVAGAVEVAEHERFDLLLSDLGLPDGDGYEVMRRIGAARAVPGIAMSGFGMDEDVRRSREAGFAHHLVKPIDTRQLVAAIHGMFEKAV